MRRRLVLAIVVVAGAAIVLFALPLAVVLHRSHRGEELLRLQRDTVAATRGIDVEAGRGDPVELPLGGDQLVVYDVRGRRLVGRGPTLAGELVRSSLRSGRPATRTKGGRLLAVVPLLTGERVTGAVLASRPGGAVARRDQTAWLGLGGLALAVLGAAAGAAWLLGRRLAAPLERLARAAGRLGEGDFASRAPRAGVTEVDAVAEALDLTTGRLDDLVTRERSFTANASHQLRTPLAALRLELEALELRGHPSPESRAALGQIDRLQCTIETLLALARDVPGQGESDLVTLIGAGEARWRHDLATSGRALQTFVRSPNPIVRSSSGVVTEVLDVLVDNARRHGSGTVTISVRDADDWVAIDVQDEGVGLSADPEAIFVQRSGMRGGHGIGLTLARSLANAEGGRLSVTRSAPHPVFTLLLCRAAAAAALRHAA